MVIDKIENYGRYKNISERLAKAFEYISRTDFNVIAPGKYEVDGDAIFAIVQEYETKEEADCNLEGHFKYIDIQYVVSGEEVISVMPLTNQIPVTKNEENDYAFYDCATSPITISAGMFTIFFQDDLHKPCMKSGSVLKVKKVVMKVLA